MSTERWTVNFLVSRKIGDTKAHLESFKIEVDPDEYVLDGVERIWAFHDRSLTFRHACHHSTCGACGMLVNGVEKLTCITTIRSVTHNGGTLKVEPLRNFPVVSDLVVDMGLFYTRMDEVKASQVVPVNNSTLPYETVEFPADGIEHERLADCIECGCCISACPVALTTDSYYGPAVLAGAHQTESILKDGQAFNLVDHADGIWRCHSGFECSAVCPSNVDPAWRIMDLRRRVIGHRIKQFFGKK
ncbi:MAG: succinate dehydrogenase/fumarate reductase iron-sulfur subunit [Anaerolineae bacterium]|nr:succinate dehydrogenase/fumarate reductase iron-sulfur subunit [Anaerolineae bacterium]